MSHIELLVDIVPATYLWHLVVDIQKECENCPLLSRHLQHVYTIHPTRPQESLTQAISPKICDLLLIVHLELAAISGCAD